MSPIRSTSLRLFALRASALRGGAFQAGALRAGAAALAGLLALAAAGPASPAPALAQTGPEALPGADALPDATWHDNDRPAGTWADGTLRLRLEVVRAAWRYLGPDGPAIPILAFREAGRAPTNPGPLIRVERGTPLEVEVSNPLEVPLVVHGLSGRRVEAPDSLVVPPGERRTASFTADAEGTWYYRGVTAGHGFERLNEDSQLNGAFVVDPPGGGPAPNERVMLLSLWIGEPGPDGEFVFERDWQLETFAINGRPWPHTERLAYALGDTVRWRVINVSEAPHPMHLHGFFFELTARGDGHRYDELWPAERTLAVTEKLEPGETMALRWVADRPGGWVYHCHLSYHVVPNAKPGQFPDGFARDHHLLTGHHGDDPHQHVVHGMGGLMMGIHVRSPEGRPAEEAARRRLRLFVQSDSTPGERRRYGYVLADGAGAPAPDSVPWPGTTIVVREGEPTSVMVINRLEEPTQVHWHGLEIDSYYDGVAGVGGYPGSLTPAIMPGDSFEMRITPPRPGSYMYHTHVSDIRQQSGGLYGAFVVLPREGSWDPETDRIVLLSASNDPDMSLLVNGSREPPPLRLEAGTRYRFRLMNVTLFNARVHVRLLRDGYPVRWRALARDGADLPPHRRTVELADRVVSIGETADFEYAPREPGELTLEARAANGRLLVHQPVRVVAAPEAEATRPGGGQ